MITYQTGDLLAAKAEALVNTVNCVGIMGRGIALQFKRAFPANFVAYAAACQRGEVQPGRMFITETGQLTPPRWIINFPTKRHWRANSRIDDIERGLEALREEIQARGIRSIAVPPLGAGLGGLSWESVRPLIEAELGGLPDVEVLLYEPHGAPRAEAMTRTPEPPRMTPGRAALISLMDAYLRVLLDPFVTLLEVHKLLYFLQEAGEPLRLEFKPARLGPYAENLRHVLRAIEGHLIIGYADGGDAPGKELDILPGAREAATSFLETQADTRGRMERVKDLVEGFETPFGLELLATVHWVAQRQRPEGRSQVVERTWAWGPNKRQFSEAQIHLALDTLIRKGWVAALPA